MRILGLIGVSNLAVNDIKPGDFDQRSRRIVYFLGSCVYLGHTMGLRSRRWRGMRVAELSVHDLQLLDCDPSGLRSILDEPVAGQRAATYIQIDAVELGLELLQWHIFDMVGRLQAGSRLGKKIRAAVDAGPSHVEDRCFGFYWRRIRDTRRPRVSNIVGRYIQMFQPERPVRIGINIGDVRVVNREMIDFDWIDTFDSVLPSFFAERHFIGALTSQLCELDTQPGME